MAKRDSKKDEQEARRLAAILWNGAHAERVGALHQLIAHIGDVRDVRWAQAAVACALRDPAIEVRRLAAVVIRKRADEGYDVRMAFPALSVAVKDTDLEVRQEAWLAIMVADERHDVARRALQPLAAQAMTDADEDIRDRAKSVVEKSAG